MKNGFMNGKKAIALLLALVMALALAACGSGSADAENSSSTEASNMTAESSVAGIYTVYTPHDQLSHDNMDVVYSFIGDGNAQDADSTYFITTLSLGNDGSYVLTKQYHFDYYENYREDPTTDVVTNTYCYLTYEGTYTQDGNTVVISTPEVATGYGNWGEGEIAFCPQYYPNSYRIAPNSESWIYQRFAGCYFVTGELAPQTIELDLENNTMSWVTDVIE
jgi:hypothetical protein